MPGSPVRVRMAPSPTGFVHLGSARTALFNLLYARRRGGVWVLRLEDTDVERNRPEFEAAIYDGFHWLGLEWDEGPDVGGPYAPYRQSERLDLYRESAARLLQTGGAYRCYCTKEELAAEREQAEREHRPYRYSRRCLTDPPSGRTEFTVRFKLPDAPERVEWDDLIRGPVAFELSELDDFIIMRTDGTPLYNFSVAVDDHQMRITHVLRGEEHVSNTPRQLLLLKALGSQPPAYAHLPVIVGQDRAKLSKRKHPEARLSLYQELGYLPAAMLNYLALLGWNPGSTEEIFSLEELERIFDLDRVQRSPAMFDWQRLDWLNGQYIRRLEDAELIELLRPNVPELPPEKLAEAMPELKTRLPRLAEARPLLEYLWEEPAAAELDPEALEKLRAARAALSEVDWQPETIEQALDAVRDEHGWSRNALFKPLRLALTGRSISLPIHYTVALLPKPEALRRLDRVLA
ncbi:MAG TPA: glutamate--tRNA ligase [Candidatus Dormibacteraeota bacterium]